MWHLVTWFSSGLGAPGLAAGFGDFKGHFQPKQFYNSYVVVIITIANGGGLTVTDKSHSEKKVHGLR